MKKNSVILYSGGIDSTVLLHFKRKEIALALYFDYGARSTFRELDVVNNFCNKLFISLQIISISQLFHNTSPVALINPQMEVSKKSAKENKSLIVPFRNGMFISMAACIAESMGLKKILYGVIGEGGSTFMPDTTFEFTEAISLAVKEGTRNKIIVEAPFGMLGKSEVINIGRKLKIPLEETYSCYAGTKVPCGKCEACLLRIKAFKEVQNEN